MGKRHRPVGLRDAMVRLNIEHIFEVLDRIRDACLTPPERVAHVVDRDGRKRIRLIGSSGRLKLLLVPPGSEQELRVPVVGHRVVGVEGDGLQELRLCAFHVPVKLAQDTGERRVRLGKSRIQVHGPASHEPNFGLE